LRPIFSVLALVAAASCVPNAVPERPDHLTAGALLEPGPAVSAQLRRDLRRVYAAGLTLTKKSEGWTARLYNDVARYCTIGYGHLIKKAPCDGSEPTEFRSGITKPAGEDLLIGDMASAQSAVVSSVTAKLTDGQFAALADFVFNVGGANFRESTVLRVVNAGQNDSVPVQLRRWVYAKGKVWPGLQTRREGEIDLYFEGLPRPPASKEITSPIDIFIGETRQRRRNANGVRQRVRRQCARNVSARCHRESSRPLPVLSENSAASSELRGTVVVVQHAAQSLAPTHSTHDL
jgi:GH24 family phage-related lysozyme (muramidase)